MSGAVGDAFARSNECSRHRNVYDRVASAISRRRQLLRIAWPCRSATGHRYFRVSNVLGSLKVNLASASTPGNVQDRTSCVKDTFAFFVYADIQDVSTR